MNFRQSIEKNKRLTFAVIVTYLLIMAGVGLIADVAVGAVPGIGFINNIIVFMTFQKLPFVTLIVSGISLTGVILIYYFGHKMMLSGIDYELVTRETTDSKKIMALNVLEEMSISAGLGYVPELYYLESAELNAFAAGWREENSLVGVTRGLLETLSRSELQAVIAHEVGHIIHGDTRLTMYVGILANIILTFTDIFAHLFYFTSSGKSSKEASIARMVLFILNLILPLVTKVLYLFLSRTREYMADAAAVKLTGNNQAMISALEKISGINQQVGSAEAETGGNRYRRASYIFSKGDSVFSTHPSIENRIKALRG